MSEKYSLLSKNITMCYPVCLCAYVVQSFPTSIVNEEQYFDHIDI
jgi:hypothetical protein